jgi:hypothetical protein
MNYRWRENAKANDSDRLDADTTARVRELYLPPAVARGDTGYWETLQARIVANALAPRVLSFAAPEQTWVGVLGGWARVGLAAAAVILFASMGLLRRHQAEDASSAYDTMTTAAAPESIASSVALATMREPSGQRDAVVNYVLTR